jgi:hypothetical protein
MAGQLAAAEREGILAAVRAGFELPELTVTHIEVRPMADGSNRWVVLTDGHNADGDERTYRTVVERNGAISEPTLLADR